MKNSLYCCGLFLMLFFIGCASAPPLTELFWQGKTENALNEYTKKAERKDNDFVLYANGYASTCLSVNNFYDAEVGLKSAGSVMGSYEGPSPIKDLLVLLGPESNKPYKGDPYEKAMNCFYLGVIDYLKGDYDNAMAYFKYGLLMDTGTSEDRYREDFTLLHFMKALCLYKLGNRTEAEEEFHKVEEVKAFQIKQIQECLEQIDAELKEVGPILSEGRGRLTTAQARLTTAQANYDKAKQAYENSDAAKKQKEEEQKRLQEIQKQSQQQGKGLGLKEAYTAMIVKHMTQGEPTPELQKLKDEVNAAQNEVTNYQSEVKRYDLVFDDFCEQQDDMKRVFTAEKVWRDKVAPPDNYPKTHAYIKEIRDSLINGNLLERKMLPEQSKKELEKTLIDLIPELKEEQQQQHLINVIVKLDIPPEYNLLLEMRLKDFGIEEKYYPEYSKKLIEFTKMNDLEVESHVNELHESFKKCLEGFPDTIKKLEKVISVQTVEKVSKKEDVIASINKCKAILGEQQLSPEKKAEQFFEETRKIVEMIPVDIDMNVIWDLKINIGVQVALGLSDLETIQTAQKMKKTLDELKQDLNILESCLIAPKDTDDSFLASCFDTDLLLILEFGRGPSKISKGQYGEIIRFKNNPSDISYAEVFINGQPVGRSLRIEDLYYQASTRGERKITRWLRTKGQIKRGTQAAGALITAYGLKEENIKIITAGSAIFLSSFLLNTEADTRCWEILPAEIHIMPFNIPSTTRDGTLIEFRFFNRDSVELPQFRQTYPFFSALIKNKKPSVYLIRPFAQTISGATEKKEDTSYVFKYCFDTIGHKQGTFPFILGGTCCCTPTEELLKQYQKDGFLANYTLDQLIEEYHNRGIVLESDEHKNCNNDCIDGPHVVKGGKCMIPPTPFTQNFIEVATGSWVKEKEDLSSRQRLNRVKTAPLKKEGEIKTISK